MKVVVFFCLVAYCSAFYSYFDGIEDVEKAVHDKALIQEVIDCFLDRGICTDKELENKKHILETYASYCADCDAVEKHKLEMLLKVMVKEFPKELEEFRKKYDLDGKHGAIIEADLAKY